MDSGVSRLRPAASAVTIAVGLGFVTVLALIFVPVLYAVFFRIPIPKPALWLRLGRELTQELLYASQRVEPSVLSDHGYQFRHPDLEEALRAALGRPG